MITIVYVILCQEEDLPLSAITRLAKLNNPEWFVINIGCICSLIAGLAYPALAILMAEILGVCQSKHICTTWTIVVQVRKKLDNSLIYLAIGQRALQCPKGMTPTKWALHELEGITSVNGN